MSRFGFHFTRHGSDKDTNHSYGAVYENLFPDPEKVRLVMEVGIAHGGGVLGFRGAFPNATVVGFDKEPCHGPHIGSEDANVYPLCPRPDRLEIHQGDLRNPDDLLRAVGGRKFDLIVEDATHLLDDNLAVWRTLWPGSIARGGIYLVEEFCDAHANRGLLEEMGAELHATGPPIAGEIIAVWRKP